MNQPTIHTVSTANADIAYFDFGNPTGIPVILLHGFPDAPVAYDDVIKRLDQKSLRLIVPYLRGYGPTEVKNAELIGGQEAALGDDLLAFANALSLDTFHLVGHDWGARTSYAACIFAPDRIRSLLALATPYIMYGGKDYPPEQVRANWYQWYFQLTPGSKAMQQSAEAFCHELWRSWSPDWDFSKSDFAAAAQAWKNPQFTDTVLHYYRTRWGGALSLRAYAGLQERLNAKPKARITVPTIYVQGAADACDLAPCSADQGSYFTSGYERVVINDVGHFPHREAPKAIAKLLSRQLAETA